MKLSLLLLFSLTAGMLSALVPGDDLTAFWKANAAKYTASRIVGPVAGWPGYEAAALATDASFSKTPFVLVLRRVGGAVLVPFGTVEGPSLLVLDSDGDGTVDVQSTKSLVPGWVALKIPGTRGDGKAFRTLSDRVYNQYNSDRGPVPAQLSLLVEEFRKQALDANNPDRDLAGALLFYLDEGTQNPSVGIGTLAALALSLKNRGGAGPLVYLFLGEALELGGLEESQSAFDRIFDLDPQSLIAAYKKARADPAKLKAFRTAHPDFWALRQ